MEKVGRNWIWKLFGKNPQLQLSSNRVAKDRYFVPQTKLVLIPTLQYGEDFGSILLWSLSPSLSSSFLFFESETYKMSIPMGQEI